MLLVPPAMVEPMPVASATPAPTTPQAAAVVLMPIALESPAASPVPAIAPIIDYLVIP